MLEIDVQGLIVPGAKIRIRFGWRVTHTTDTQEIGVCVQPDAKHHKSIPDPIQVDFVHNLNQ